LNVAHCQDKNVNDVSEAMSPSWNLLNNATWRKCGQEEESSYHILCQCPGFDGHRMKISGFEFMGPIDISTDLMKQVVVLD
jgi:type VI protein secretion system component Hcp